MRIANPADVRLMPVKFVKQANGYTYLLYRCACGVEKVIKKANVDAGRTRSCGCFALEVSSKVHTTHGRVDTLEYNSYYAARDRTTNPKSKDWDRYGGRGITMCARWVESFGNFFEDMGIPPAEATSLERVDNNKGYEKNNCKWATAFEQANNRRRTL